MSFRNNSGEMLRRFGAYRIASTHSNAAFKIPFENTYLFLKVYGPKHPRLTYEIRKFLDIMGMRQPVEYMSPRKRKIFEEETLALWKNHGYCVPLVRENPFSELENLTTLTTTFIEGITLREIIQDEGMAWSIKEKKLEALFEEVSTRHTHVFESGDVRLFHIDANSRNILFAGDAVCHCDFEMGRPWEPIVQSAAREILKMLISIADDVESERRETVINLFRSCYREGAVYDHIREGITGRPFQGLHRYRDSRKKQRAPEKTTLYDILASLS
ncbi:MAG: hypothetical protein JW743_09180 [Deltaproteobacteria bacterium]|nr:hypothetical protein [Deltaproteobacteria bacterium]